MKENLPWETSLRNLFSVNGLQDLFQAKVEKTEDSSRKSAANILIKRLKDQFYQTSFEAIKTSSKMKTLSLLKREPGKESYLSVVSNARHRFLLSCPMSKELREKFLPKHILNNSRLNDDEKFTKIISDPKNTAKFTFLAFEHRDITLDVLNTLQDMMGNVETLLREQNFNKEDNIEYVVKDV